MPPIAVLIGVDALTKYDTLKPDGGRLISQRVMQKERHLNNYTAFLYKTSKTLQFDDISTRPKLRSMIKYFQILETMASPDTKGINEAYFNACNFYSLMRGVHFVVLWMALANIFTNKKRTTVSRRVMTFLVILMFILSSVDYGSFWAYVRRAFVEHGETSRSIADSLQEYPKWFIGLSTASDVNAIIADGIMIWRCWVIWGQVWRIIGLPIICTIMTTVFSVIALHNSLRSTSFAGSGADYATALYSTSLATTIYCTGMILYRIYCIVKIQGPGPGLGIRTYHGVIEILVESSALYCTATLFALVAYVRGGGPSEFAWVFWTSTTGIAPTLIVARATAINARSDQSWSNLSTRFSRPASLPRFNVRDPNSHELRSPDEPTASGTTAWSEDVETVNHSSQSGKKLGEPIAV